MAFNIEKVRKCLKEFNLQKLFIDELGWDYYSEPLRISLDNIEFELTGIAQKRGMVAFKYNPTQNEKIPTYPVRRKIERIVAKSIHEHIIIYIDSGMTKQVWQWVKREIGKPTACREHTYYKNQPGDSLIGKLRILEFILEEEETLTTYDVTSRVRAAFDVERVTKRFYDYFKTEHESLLEFINGIPDVNMERWYVSVIMNRLMFIYFIQRRGFLGNGDMNYLRNKFESSKKKGKNRYYQDFLCPLFFQGFAKREHERPEKIQESLGQVPYLNGGIFLQHQVEKLYGKKIRIPDAAFERLFTFFDKYQWHLDDRPLKADNEINPDVLGYIFEKYINAIQPGEQKAKGAYYTKEDITGYISKNTIIPFLFKIARKKCEIAFEKDQFIWKLLKSDPDRYIYYPLKKGVELQLPPEIEEGIEDISNRIMWNNLATEEYGLPTEIWRDVVERHQRYHEIKNKILSGEIYDINDFITYNLDIQQFAQDVIENSEGPELIRAFWQALENISILDPACGSGAFLFAALNILESIYEACLNRMEVFLEELEHMNNDYSAEKFSDFKNILSNVEKHLNLRHFIFKSIIVNNIYGVDIMEEATEIAKLRLFLKLVSQVEKVEDLEPLPDIDFNIRTGNTLVGFSNKEEIQESIHKASLNQSRLPLEEHELIMKQIEERAEAVDVAFQKFHDIQTEDVSQNEIIEAKKELTDRLVTLEEELNRYLSTEYGIKFNVHPQKYTEWKQSHLPFHWLVDFYGILKKGGFDVIIGNPPYIEYGKIKSQYTIKKYKTENCGNLYAFMIERSLKLLATKGHFGMIVPLSSLSTPRMSPLLNLYSSENARIWASFYAGDSNPSTLFTGVKSQLSIHLLERGKFEIFTTNYIRWFEEARQTLFPTLNYVNSTDFTTDNYAIKVGSTLELDILSKIRQQQKVSSSFFSKRGKKRFYYRNASGSYYRLFTTQQPLLWLDGKKRSSTTLKEQFITISPSLAVSVFSSSLFHWLWTVISDNYHITNKEFNEFKIDFDVLPQHRIKKLEELCSKLMRNYEKNSSIRIEMDKRHGVQRKVQIFEPRLSKLIIDQIDKELAQHYGFTDEELDFIINYDIKFRSELGNQK